MPKKTKEALSRLSEAHARMHLRNVATEEDAKVALAVFKHWRSENNVHDETEFHSSVPQQKMIVDREIRKIITSICYEKGQAMIEEIYDKANQKGITPKSVDDIIAKLRQGGVLFSPSNDVYSFA